MPTDRKPAIYVLIVSVAVLLIIWRLNDISDTKKAIRYLSSQPALVSDSYTTSEPEQRTITYKVGQMAEVEGIEITLQSWKKLSEDEALIHDIVSPSSSVYLLSMTAKNNTAEHLTLNAGEIRVNHNGSILQYLQEQNYHYLELSPLQKGAIRFLYLIPKEATGEMYWYPSTYTSDTIRFER